MIRQLALHTNDDANDTGQPRSTTYGAPRAARLSAARPRVVTDGPFTETKELILGHAGKRSGADQSSSSGKRCG